ncbi:MAG: right-handed parallel beta-helix repeat-containing protein [Phycisphaerales bacterium]
MIGISLRSDRASASTASVRRWHRPATIGGAILLAASPLTAAEWIVPDDFALIQWAIEAASDGDVVLVRPGEYFEVIDFLGKAITVRSLEGPEVTVINGRLASDAVVSFSTGESLDSILQGFELREGTGSTDIFWAYGGGVFIWNASATIRDCILRENVVTTDGGGLYVLNGAAVLENVRLESNATEWYNGGGIYARNASVHATGCEFVSNHTNGGGGAVLLEQASGSFIDCRFELNTADRGGAIKLNGGPSLLIESCLLLGNISDGWGGAVQGACDSMVVRSSEFVANRAGGEGGAIDSDGGVLLIEQCQFIANECLGRGGGICRNGAGTVVLDSTFEGNLGRDGEGGGLSIAESGPYEVRRCVFRGNSAHRGGGFDGRGGGDDAVVAMCRFEGNEASLGKGGGARLVGGGHFVSNVLSRNRSTDRGGGLHFEGASAETGSVANCVFIGNLALWHGGGLDVRDSAIPVSLCTFLGNGAGESAGGVNGRSSSPVTNCILIANHAPHGPVGSLQDLCDLRHCLVDVPYPGEGNRLGDPAFVDRLGPDGVAFSGDEALRTAWCGAAVDVAVEALLPADVADLDEDGDRTEPLPWDVRNAPRVLGAPDLGAFETSPLEPPCTQASDCNGNGIRDEVDLAECDGSPWCGDCNGNRRPDACDLLPGPSTFDPGIAYWRFESPGDEIVPESPFEVPGVVLGATFSPEVPLAEIPASGRANLLSLEVGPSGRVKVADPMRILALGDTDFTIEAWVRLDELAGMQDPGKRQYLVQRKPLDAGGTKTDFAFLAQWGNSPLAADRRFGRTSGFTGRELSIQFGTGAEVWCVTSNLRVERPGWHFISVAHRADPEEAWVRFGLDGEFEEFLFDPESHLALPAPVIVAAHTSADGTYNQRIRGAVDELRITRRVLAPGELLDRRPYGSSGDCNVNGRPDDCDIADGTLSDVDRDGVPDECERTACRGDLDDSGDVDGLDLAILFASWGGGGAADLDDSGVVDGLDLTILFAAWGACETDPCDGVVCDDGLACTIDLCDPATGQCRFIPIEGCEPDPCENVDCDDGNHCTTDACDARTGECVHTPIEGCEPFVCGSPSAGPCGQAHPTPACDDAACCKQVCAFDPICCDVAWDAECAALAGTFCP